MVRAPFFMREKLHVAIVGATGAVGIELLKLLEKRNFPVARLTLLASARSAGKTLPFAGESLRVHELTEDSFKGVDLALFSAGGAAGRNCAALLIHQGLRCGHCVTAGVAVGT